MKNDYIPIPYEIRKMISAKITKRLLLFALLMGVFAFAVVMWGDFLFREMDEKFWAAKYILYALFLISPVFITSIYKIFTDTDYYGTVKCVEIDTVMEIVGVTKLRYQSKNELCLVIETPDGKTIRRRVHKASDGQTAVLERYEIGDRVLYLHGTGVTVVLPTDTDTHCQCVLCGGMNRRLGMTCAHCDRPLVNFDLFH